MISCLENIVQASTSGQKQLALLIDPDKFDVNAHNVPIGQLQYRGVTHIFVGGSEVSKEKMMKVVDFVKAKSDLPLIIFPGHPDQICEDADALLFLSLLSGRNPDFIIGKQVEAASRLINSELEIIPTAYLLINGGNRSSIERVTGTKPLVKPQEILNTALAAMFLGMKLVYLEAGSGAINPVSHEIIKLVRRHINVPLIVGGGIRSARQLTEAYENGADLVVMGNIFETQPDVLNEIEGVMNSYAGNY